MVVIENIPVNKSIKGCFENERIFNHKQDPSSFFVLQNLHAAYISPS